ARNRLSRWLAITMFTTGCILGAGLVDSLGQTIYALLVTPAGLPSGGPIPSMTGVSSLLASLAPLVVGGRMFVRWVTPGAGKKKRVSLPSSLVAGVAAGLVVLILLVGLGVGSHWAFWAGGVPAKDPGFEFAKAHFDKVPAVDVSPDQLIRVHQAGEVHPAPDPDPPPKMEEPSAAIFLAFAFTVVTSWLSGRTFAFLTLSSHQTIYGSRVTRAYLGASNPARQGPLGRRVTESIAGDDLPFDEYRPHERGGPLHILNVTLNETIGGESEVLDRDRK